MASWPPGVTYAVPLYQALLVSLEIVAAAIFFRELASQPARRLLGFGLGVAVATAGLVVLSRTTRDEGEGRRGAAPPPKAGDARTRGRVPNGAPLV